MENALPPLPNDLWPHAHPAQAHRPKGKMLTVEVPGLSETLLLSVLARAIHLEMKAAGEWAARVGTPVDNDFPSSGAFTRYRAENAARLLSLYTAVFAVAHYLTTSDLTPQALRSSASHSFQVGLRDQRRSLELRNQSLSPTAPPSGRSSPLTPRR